ANGKSRSAKEAYQKDIAEVFRRVLRSMHDGGRFIVVANDQDNLYGDIAASLDVEVENIIERHVNRRTGRRSKEFFESIFIWRKI
ncbi:MAG: class I SAM-dependent methyltransferase, partial [Methanocalculus sp.]|nr:class I SAM-dependent methyltransferase [Methanocalculus sp.]